MRTKENFKYKQDNDIQINIPTHPKNTIMSKIQTATQEKNLPHSFAFDTYSVIHKN